MKEQQKIKKIALVTALLTLVLVGLGGYVRATGAGLACPDWPLCFDKFVPKMRYGVVQEVMHRYLALVVSILIAVMSWKVFKLGPAFKSLRKFSIGLLGILGVQVVLGGLTVLMLLNPYIVTAHLACGTIIVQLLLLLSMEKTGEVRESPSSENDSYMAKLLYFMSGLVYLQILLGGFVGSSGASMACPDIPFCQGQLYSATFNGPQLIQMLHRANGILIAFAALVCFLKARQLQPALGIKPGHMVAMMVMIWIQISLGFANVVMSIPVAPAVTHLVLAQLILFGYLVPARRLSGKKFFGKKLAPTNQTSSGTSTPLQGLEDSTVQTVQLRRAANA